jgi:polysaccharide biosynthesis/export protein
MRHTPLLAGLLALAVLLLSACGGANVRSNVGSDPLPPPDTTSASGAYKGVTDYRLGSQDLIQVSVFGVEELSATARVNSNGQVSLPLIGAVMAGGLTIPELEAELSRRYADGYLQKPQVTVFVEEFASQRVTVEGSVKKPGIYPLSGRTTLLQAIAVAEGLDEFADLGGIVLFRQVDGRRMGAVYDMRALRSGKIDDPQVYGDDMIVVEQSGSKTAFRRFIQTIPSLGVFAWF